MAAAALITVRRLNVLDKPFFDMTDPPNFFIAQAILAQTLHLHKISMSAGAVRDQSTGHKRDG
jgi:hypothetical protein